MNNNNKKVHPDINKFNREDGFAFTAMAVVVAVILGFIGLFLKNNASVNVAASADHYSTTQSFWSAVTGIDFILENLDFDAGNTDNTYTFYNSSVNVTTELINVAVDPTDSTYEVISTGTHGGHVRKLSLLMEPPTPFDNTYFDIDGPNWFYADTSHWGCNSNGYPMRYWGSSCDACTTTVEMPEYVLLESFLPVTDPGPPPVYLCYWIGKMEQNPFGMEFITIPDLGGVTNIELSVWIGVGIDVMDVDDQSRFQNGDDFEIIASIDGGENEITLELWSGPPGFGPMSPTINATLGDLQPQFNQYFFNISDVFGSIDSLDIQFVGNSNNENKYTGFAGIELSYDLNWIIDISSIQEQ